MAGLLAGVPGMAAKPIEAVENACASGGQAVLSGIYKLQAGMGETAIAVGLEKMRDDLGRADGVRVGTALGYFSDPAERGGKTFVFPHIFAEIMQQYMEHWSVSEAELCGNRGAGICQCEAQSVCADAEGRGDAGTGDGDRRKQPLSDRWIAA